jgi:hypothetical protein
VRRARRAASLLAVGCAALAPPARAQGVCDGRPIRAIQIDPRTVFSADDSLIPGVVRSLGNAFHSATREETVRQDLLFAVGDRCDPRRLSETERLLRARPYIRTAEVIPIATADSGVTILVRTRDEFSLEVRLRLRGGDGFPVRRLAVAEDDILGRGIHGRLLYSGFGRRPAYSIDLTDPHFTGRRTGVELLAGKSAVGPVIEETVRRAFESDFDRLAWRASGGYSFQPFPLVSTTLGTVLEPVLQIGGDAGAAVRIGEPGRLHIVGVVLSAERLLVQGDPLAPTPDLDSVAAAQLAGRFEERRRIRVHLLLGARRLAFRAYRGLDALDALEDAPVGAQAGLVLGTSLFGGGGLEHDWFAATEFASGTEVGARALVFTHAKVEGRFVTSAGRWDGVIADGQLLVYGLGARATDVLSIAAAGGWSTRTPFQLLLAGADGIRGYGDQRFPVGSRIVVHAERRYFLGGLFGFADVGAAVFADAGRGWAGDVAFGENSGLLGTVGAGLRLAAPRGSRRTYRLDLAVPLSRGRGPELRLAVGQQFGIFHGEPDDVVRSRERISSITVFDFPRF